MKLVLLASKTENKELMQELRRFLSVNPQNIVEQDTLGPDNLQRIQSARADLVVTVNLSGFEFTTLTDGISYNLWNTKFIHFLTKRSLQNEPILAKPLSISMFFYCQGKDYKEYLQKKYPHIPYLEEITGWKEEDGPQAVKSNAEKMTIAIYQIAKECNLPSPISLEQESEFYFQQLKEELPETEAACRYIDEVLNEALKAQDKDTLLSLIPFIESGKGKLAWKYIGEIRRTLQILLAVRLEIKYHTEIFCIGCQSKAELEEKYLVMLFALRRLVFCLSEESVEGAERFLKSANLSPFVLHMALQNELLPTDLGIYQRIADLYEGIWDEEERCLFLQMAEMVEEESIHG